MSSQPLLSRPKSPHHAERLAECRSYRGAIWYRLRCGSAKCCSRHLRFFGHICRADPSQDHSQALYASTTGLPKHWRRPGRPRQTWLRTIENDLQPLNLSLQSAGDSSTACSEQNSLADTRRNGCVADKLQMMKMMMMT